MHKKLIGVFAIAVLASAAAINVAAAQKGPAADRVEPTPMAGGGPGKLPSSGEGPAATVPSRPETGRVESTPMAGGGPGTLPSPTAAAPSAEPSRNASTGRRAAGEGQYRYGDRGNRYYGGRDYGGGFAYSGGPFGYYNDDDYGYYPYGAYASSPYGQDCYEVRRIHTRNGWHTRRVYVCN
jgi:hypothetical protein